ncbi:MAG: efflux RND transporter periplasmic adaptor subunit [Deltaproteobacteria bacterium]|nr:efflux RND transporter periplasmic adaptor subunit [Deltaproteobacteria bacterium]
MNTVDSIPTRSKKKVALWVGLILAAFVVGYCSSRTPSPGPPTTKQVEKGVRVDREETSTKKDTEHDHESTIWTCAMHPQIRMPNPGKCPICFMDLIPLETSGSDSRDTRGASTISMSETARKLSEIETTEVRRERAKTLIHMVGMVFEAETRQAVITSRIEGRLDEVYVNFTGESVNKGDPLVKIWSPTLIKSQVELFETIKSDPDEQSVIKGAEEKLIQYGLDREQIDQIKTQKRPTLYVTLKAPITGIVTKKNAILGQFVKEGTEMFVINDLSDVWVKMDAYETDLPWIRYGQNITFTTSAVPGKIFHGKVLFIDPTLDTKTRSVKVRVDAPNPDYLLKPGMFVSAELEAELDDHGKVIKPEWAGKYVCPVHPRDEASETPGVCPDSKMPLRPASSYGYADNKDSRSPLLIPITAPLITGKRAIVYVEVPGTSVPTYELREVTLGSRVENQYIVDSGLKEGERVVTKGAFKIDSTMQIQGKTSMMAPAEKKSPDGQKADDKSDEETIEKVVAPKSFIAGLTPIFVEYIKLKDAIGVENSEAAIAASSELTNSLKKIDTSVIDPKQKKRWTQFSNGLLSTATKIANNKNPVDQRRFFNSLSETAVKILMTFGQMTETDLTIFHCPKAFDGAGAYWIGKGDDRKNPFYKIKPENDQEPVECAEIVEKITPEKP